MKFRKSHREEVPVSMDDTAPSAPEGAAPAASSPSDAPADPAAPRYKFPTWFDLLALVGLFVVIQLVVAFVLLLAGARMPDAAALGSADETVAARAHAAAAQFNFYAYPLTMGLMIGLTLIYRRLRGGNHRLGRYAVRGEYLRYILRFGPLKTCGYIFEIFFLVFRVIAFLLRCCVFIARPPCFLLFFSKCHFRASRAHLRAFG